MSPHAHLARSPVGLADKVWLEAVGREPGENSPWYRSHVLAQRPKLASERLIRYQWGRHLKMTPDTSGMPLTASGRERPPDSDACKQAPRGWRP